MADTPPTDAPDPNDELVAALWPEMAARLGERRSAFFATARQQAARHGLADGPSATRYLNLCFVFGPAFEQRPENEWALALLADQRLAPWVRLHQLLRRAAVELQRRNGDAAALARTDAAVIDALDAQALERDLDAQPLPRAACDVDAVDLRVLDSEWRHEYRRIDGVWQRVPGPAAPPALRVDAEHPAPDSLHLLSQAPSDGPAARLQLRQAVHAGCEGGRHPAVRWIDTAGLQRWRGHAARAVSWPVSVVPADPPRGGLGTTLLEAAAPTLALLHTEHCGVRDSGVPLGPLRCRVQVYPSQQWMLALQRGPGAERHWPPTADAPAAPPPTRFRLERDGLPLDAAPWLRGFDQGLPQALATGLEKLFGAWQKTAQQASMHITPALLSGRAGFTWGWREGPDGIAAPPLLRVQGEVDLGCQLDLQLEGEIETGSTRTRVRLRARGGSTLQMGLNRENPEPGLVDTLLPLVLRWRCPFEIDHDPIAADDGAVWLDAGPCTGALGGEAGLRPALSGNGGWEWYVRLMLEPVLAPYVVHDPVLGQTRRTLALLPAMPLLDWSLG